MKISGGANQKQDNEEERLEVEQRGLQERHAHFISQALDPEVQALRLTMIAVFRV